MHIPIRSGRTQVLTLEADAAHAVVAQNLIAFAGLSHAVEVLTGHSEDLLPWLAERLAGGGHHIDFAFLDQRGSRYEADLAVLQRADLLSDGAILVADNVLKPGAPLFLWQVSTSRAFTTEVVSVPEFAMSDVEDWMTVSTYHKACAHLSCEEAPKTVRVLEWRADQMRARTHQPQFGGGGVDFTEWSKFSQEMHLELCSVLKLQLRYYDSAGSKE
ncbi:unnamed protein product, partial [Polarella glacialis]